MSVIKTSIKNTTKLDSENYINQIMLIQSKNLVFHKKQEKIENDNISIPGFHEYTFLLKYNYNAQHLKQIAKYYKLKTTGNKKQLISRIQTYLFLSNSILKIQKVIKGYLQRKYDICHGPAYLNRSLCTNAYDFFTMDEMTEINLDQFFSYKDEDGFIYGFDIISLYNLINKSSGIIKNPYNRIPINQKVMETFKTLFRLGNILNIKINVEIKNTEINNLSVEKTIELRTLSLFQSIDNLGNYTNSSWFMSLNRNQLIRFLRELLDIWTYRAQLSMEVKRLICPPLGDPFNQMHSLNMIQNYENIFDIRKEILFILEKFVNSGIDRDNKSLGAYYVLAALTLVNNDAASALPWLYQSVVYL